MRVYKLIILLFFVISSSLGAQEFFSRAYGGGGSDYAYSVQETSDGGYIFCGPGTLGAGLWDFWVVKLDEKGNINWEKTYGGSSNDIPNSIIETMDKGFLISGRTQSFGAGGFDAWVIKIDSNGNRLWQKTFGGSGDFDAAYSAVQSSDGNYYYVAGWSNSFGSGSYDYWIIKLDSSGDIVWQKTTGGTQYECAYSICLAGDGGVVVAGGGYVGAGGYDVWVVKLDSSGNNLWQKAFGGTSDDMALSVQKTNDDGFILTGFTKSFGAGNQDFWVLKLDLSGSLEWQKTYGGTSVDWAFSVKQTFDGGYIVAGRTDSFGVGNDALIIKLDAIGNLEWQRTYGGSGFEYVYSVLPAKDGSFICVGLTNSFGAGDYDAMIVKLESNCILGNSCPYLSGSSIAVSNPNPTITSTSKSLLSTSCATSTVISSISNSSSTTTIQCLYPVLPDSVSVSLKISKSGENPVLDWNNVGGFCSVSGYSIYRGTLPISNYDHTSIDCNNMNLIYTDLFSTGDHYYLVVPQNNYLEGSYGADSSGREIPSGISSCKPKCLLPCK